MNIAMLWFDNNCKTSFEDKVQQAAKYFADKYGPYPTRCHVSLTVKDAPAIVGNIVIEPSPYISPGYFWIGLKDQERI